MRALGGHTKLSYAKICAHMIQTCEKFQIVKHDNKKNKPLRIYKPGHRVHQLGIRNTRAC